MKKDDNRKKKIHKILGTAATVLLYSIMVLDFLLTVDLILEGCSRNSKIERSETVVVVDIKDVSKPDYTDGIEMHSAEYMYYLDYVDTAGVFHRHTVDGWSPWLDSRYARDGYGISIGDTLELYHFFSGMVIGIRGNRKVFEKDGRYYE
jgi:hypothetical protein